MNNNEINRIDFIYFYKERIKIKKVIKENDEIIRKYWLFSGNYFEFIKRKILKEKLQKTLPK